MINDDGDLILSSARLARLTELIEAGTLAAALGTTYPLAETAEAHRFVESGYKRGGFAVTILHERQVNRMSSKSPTIITLVVKTVIVHTITYFLMGILAATFLNYAERFARPELICWMRPTTDPMVMAGVLFQPLRGIVFALVFFPLREQLFGRRNGWLLLWWLLVALGILGTFGPAPGSIEGLVYTVIPWIDQVIGWLEVVPQALLLSLGLWLWVRYAEQRWLNWLLGIAFVIVLALPILGLLVTA